MGVVFFLVLLNQSIFIPLSFLISCKKIMTPLEAEEVLNRTINNQYGLVRKIGSGSFGTIYLGTESRTKTELAIKVERKYSRKPQLPFESQVYKRLNHPFMKSMRPPGFPKLRYFGVDNDYSYLVMDLVGPTLESLFNFCSRSFKLKTVLQIMDQLGKYEFFVYINSWFPIF